MRRAASAWLAALLISSPTAVAATPPDFSDAAFSSAQEQGRTIVVETYASWCLPCRIQSPILERLHSGAPFRDVIILRIGEKTPSTVWKRFRLNGFGTLVIFKGHREMARGNPTNEAAVAELLRRGR